LLLFGALAAIFVTATTTLVNREWHKPHENGEPLHVTPADEVDGFTDMEGEMKDEEAEIEGSQENLNVLHLLYTIAQVLLLSSTLILGSSAPGWLCA
jgi:hypothetical protein